MNLISLVSRRPLAGLTLFVGLLLAGPARAQDDPGSTGPTPNAPTAVPLDGAAALLLAGGMALGVKMLRQRNAR